MLFYGFHTCQNSQVVFRISELVNSQVRTCDGLGPGMGQAAGQVCPHSTAIAGHKSTATAATRSEGAHFSGGKQQGNNSSWYASRAGLLHHTTDDAASGMGITQMTRVRRALRAGLHKNTIFLLLVCWKCPSITRTASRAGILDLNVNAKPSGP